MSQLYEICRRKMTERPEACVSRHPAYVETWLISADDQIRLLYAAKEDMFSVYVLRAGGPRAWWQSAEKFWATRRNAGVLDFTAVPETTSEPVPGGVEDRTARATPVTQADSIYGYTTGGTVTVIGAIQADGTDDRRGLWRFTLDGAPLPPGFQAIGRVDASAWWRDVDAGRLVCLDDDIAAGRKTLTFEPDGNGSWYFVLDGRRYLDAAPMEGDPLNEYPEAGDPERMRRTAKNCVAWRKAAQRILSAL